MLRTQNLHVVKTEPLVAPRVIKRELPGSDALYEVVVRARATIRDIIAGRDRRLLAVVGPCSIHDPEAALDYGGRRRAPPPPAGGQPPVPLRVSPSQTP